MAADDSHEDNSAYAEASSHIPHTPAQKNQNPSSAHQSFVPEHIQKRPDQKEEGYSESADFSEHDSDYSD